MLIYGEIYLVTYGEIYGDLWWFVVKSMAWN